jgi:acyl-CoA synthetase (AMP-forming)/AMP-acid ligase II
MFSMMFLGIIGAGGIFAGSNPGYTPYELTHHFRTSETRFIVTEPEMLGQVLEAAKKVEIPTSNILIFNVLGQPIPAGFQSWETLLTHGEEDWVRFDDLQTAKTTEAARMFSSGTTGLPKAAMVTHYNLIAHHTLVWHSELIDYDVKRLLTFPMFHAAAVPVSHTTTLKAGHEGIVMRRFDLAQFLSNIERYQITDLSMAPPIAVAAVMAPITKNYNLKSLKNAVSGAAPLDKGPQAKFEALMGDGSPFTQVWGEVS